MLRLLVILLCFTAGCSGNYGSNISNKIGSSMVQKIESSRDIRVLGQGVLSNIQTEKIKELILNDNSYIFDRTKKCPFFPEAVLMLDDNSEMQVSFSCAQIKFIDGTTQTIVDCDPVVTTLSDLLKQEK